MEAELEDILSRDDALETHLVRVERLLEKEKLGRKSPSPINTQTSTPPVQPAVEDRRINLPKLEIQKFDGNVLNWNAFWDSRHRLTNQVVLTKLRNLTISLAF